MEFDRMLGKSVLSSVISAVGLTVTLVAWTGAANAQTIDFAVDGPDPLSGAPNVRLSGFAAGEEVEVSFIRTPPDGAPPAYRSTARYLVDADGGLSLSSRPVAGDWSVSAPEAPFWSMQPDPNAPRPRVGVVRVEVKTSTTSHQAEYDLPQPVGVETTPVQGFPGAFLSRPSNATGPLPMIIVLGGSEGDDGAARAIAPRLAAEGFAAFGLPYRSPMRGDRQAIPGLPAVFSEIPVERLEQVRQWAVNDPRVDPESIGVWGVSKGAEFALIAAANYPWIDAVVALVPTDVVWEGFGSGTLLATGTPSFSLDGQPLPFVPYGEPGRLRRSKDTGRWRYPERAAAARIRVEQYAGLLLVAGAGQDRVTDSAGMSQAIAERRAESGLSTVSLIFPDVGHGLVGSLLDPIEVDQDGSPEDNGLARKAVWAASIALFRAAWPQ
jgi:dienelactone hydrolase